MHKARMVAGLLTACFLVAVTATLEAAPPGPADILRYSPKQQGITCSTPTEQEQASCEVKLISGSQRGSSGWLLRDAQGRPVRRFFDTNGDKKIDVWSYYLDGVEVYREIDTAGTGNPNQYRWLNAGGMKWGIDVNGDGKIDGWKMISAEEVGQEVLQAVMSRDFSRLQALWVSEAEIKALDLPAAEAARLRELQKQAYAKFQGTVAKLPGSGDKTHFLRLETAAPQCIPADAADRKQDLVKHAKATVLYENAGKHDWLNIGELIQVGLAWRIVDSPVPGDGGDVASAPAVDPAVQPWLDKLRDLDAKNKGLAAGAMPGNDLAIVDYNLKRADILEQIVGKVKPEEREQWIRQVADCLSTAAQNSSPVAYSRLVSLEKQIVEAMPGSNLAAWVTFREMQAEYAEKLAKAGQDFGKVQEAWLARLAKFVELYPKAEDTPDAFLQLGMVSEFVTKEIEAKKWYENLAKNFPNHQLAGKAEGALRRLDVEGKPLQLAGPLLQGGAFNIAQVQGKVVVVYYWASWNQQCLGDFAKLNLLLKANGSMVELVCVNLDNTAAEAIGFMQRSPAPGAHLFVPGGLESPLATQYGIMVLPNLFLVGKDGKVVSRTLQVNNLEEEIKKLLK